MNKKIQSILEIDNNIYDEFMLNHESNYKLNYNLDRIEYDYSWLDAIEDTLISLDNVVRNPRRFIATEEELVPVEKAKKITLETIRHLAQHTNLIQDVTDDQITPSYVLNINKEESFDIYENRFIYTLLLNLRRFIALRKEIVKSGSFSKIIKETKYTGKTKIGNEEIYMDLEIKSHDLASLEPKGLSVDERVEKIEMIIGDFFKSEFIKEMANSVEVKSPIRKTNVILKNADFKKALALWEFIQKYDVKSKQIEHEENIIEPNQKSSSMMGLNFLINYKITDDLLRKKTSSSNKLTKTYLRRIINDFVDYNDKMTLTEFKQVLSKEFTKSKKQKQIKKDRVLKELDTLFKKHKKNINNCLNIYS